VPEGRPHRGPGVLGEPGRAVRPCSEAPALPVHRTWRHLHRFTPPLPRELTEGGVCATCDTHVAAHAGPVVSRSHRHRLHLVAEALVAVGRGVSCTRVSQRARVAAGRGLLTGDGTGVIASIRSSCLANEQPRRSARRCSGATTTGLLSSLIALVRLTSTA